MGLTNGLHGGDVRVIRFTGPDKDRIAKGANAFDWWVITGCVHPGGVT